MYAAGYREIESQVRSRQSATADVTSLNAVTVSMQVAAAEEIRKVEKYMPWLATTGSVTPFIGLFGTVWGVMDAFTGLGTAGAASLRAVAPGIAEALITTAAGLFTAVPAVIAYNHFLHDIRIWRANGQLRDGSRRDGRKAISGLERRRMGYKVCLGTRRFSWISWRSNAAKHRLEATMPQLSRQTGTSLSEINIVPFVDVMLVLLVIFMITAPILQSGIEVDVPKTKR